MAIEPPLHASRLDSPVGDLVALSDGAHLVRLTWAEELDDAPDLHGEDAVSRETSRQLKAYFAGELTAFELPIRFARGTDFEQAVLRGMLEIPHGETRTYGDLAQLTDGIARAVGTACGRNPIPIVVPCHRVVGSDGKLVVFSGGKGVETKSWLLDFERGQKRLF